MPPPEHVVQCSRTPILVPGLQLFFRLFEAAQTRERLGGFERQLARASPAVGGKGVLPACLGVPLNFPAAPRIATSGQPDGNVPVEVHAEMWLRLERHLAFQAGDRIAPVTTRQPDLVAKVMD